MTPQEQQLVQMIAREVIAQLRARQQGSGTSPLASSSQAERSDANIQPPIGTCTGDYSKFPELADRLNPPRQSQSTQGGTGASQAAAPVQQTQPAQAMLTGFVTENQLREAIKASSSGVALLSPDAKLTPLGHDFARQFPEKIRRAEKGQAAREAHQPSTGSNTAGESLPWLWWIQGQCPVVAKVTSERASKLRTISASASGDNLVRVIRELAGAIKAGQAAGGLLFVPSAARAICLANRCPSIRAVVATCGQAVEEGLRELGANVLIIEYPHHGPRAVSAMVDRFIAQSSSAPASVQRELADLHRCG